ncbi:hypothetical protein DXG01_006182 [Tephrocybe rancida]|nr:hypothetical protein DXG01_006182 [Tephrocybe rancida]
MASVDANKTYAHDTEDDWDVVDEDFRKEYPPLQNNRNTVPEVQSCFPASISAQTAVTQLPVTTTTSASDVILASTSTTPHVTRAGRAVVIPTHKSAESSHQQDDPDLKGTSNGEPPQSAEEIEPLPDLKTFLASLEHDLSMLLGPLDAQDLGTSEKLFALAHWPEKKLLAMLEMALPQATVPQRFMLVNGMKSHV